MELRDFIVTPVILILVFWGAYVVRPWVTDEVTRKYFFPALWVRVFGALALGFLYQFYYGGGDTFNFHTHGSRHIWEAFTENPITGFRLIFSNGEYEPGTFQYASKIWFYKDPSSFFVIRVAALFDLLTFSTYSATAVLFALLSFTGVWLLFNTFYDIAPQRHKWFAAVTLFVPSVFFWGSGILKDSLTLAAVGWATYGIYLVFIKHQRRLFPIVLIIVGCFVLYFVKLYILLCFLPAVIIWIFLSNFSRIHSRFLKFMLAPIVIFIAGLSSYWAAAKVAEGDRRYELDVLAKTAYITAYDIGFYTGRGAGSHYSLGELDGTLEGMLQKAPQAINVSLFRPYLWEVNNALMLLSAFESLFIIGFTIYVLGSRRFALIKHSFKPITFFCLIFSLTFAFAVGVSTYNFGTLVRYKIPLIPFYLAAIVLLDYYSKSNKKLGVLELPE